MNILFLFCILFILFMMILAISATHDETSLAMRSKRQRQFLDDVTVDALNPPPSEISIDAKGVAIETVYYRDFETACRDMPPKGLMRSSFGSTGQVIESSITARLFMGKWWALKITWQVQENPQVFMLRLADDAYRRGLTYNKN